MAFKLELSKTQVSSVFTPMDVKLFESRHITSRFVFLFIACDISIASSSFKRLWSSDKCSIGGSLSRYSAI
jgi:hypothetical protein